MATAAASASAGTAVLHCDMRAPGLVHLLDHRIIGRLLAPGAALLEVAACAGRLLTGAKHSLTYICFMRPHVSWLFCKVCRDLTLHVVLLTRTLDLAGTRPRYGTNIFVVCAAGAAAHAALGSMLLHCAIPAPAQLAPGYAVQLQCSVSLAAGALRVLGASAAPPHRSSPASHLLATLARGMQDEPMQPGSGLGSLPLPSQLPSTSPAGTALAGLLVGAESAGLGPRPSAFARLSDTWATGMQPGGFLCPPALADGCLQLGAALAGAARAPRSTLRVPSAIGAYRIAHGPASLHGSRRACSPVAPAATAALGGALPGRGALSSYRLHTLGFLPAMQLADLVAAPIGSTLGRNAAGASESAKAEPHLMYQVAWQAAKAGVVHVSGRLRTHKQRCRMGVRWALSARNAADTPTIPRHMHERGSTGMEDPTAACLADLAFLGANVGDASASTSLLARGGSAHVCEPVPAGRMVASQPMQDMTTGSATQASVTSVAAAWALAKVAASEYPSMEVLVTQHNAATVPERFSLQEGTDAFGTLLSGSAAFAPRLLPYSSPSSHAGAHLLARVGGAVAVAGGLGGEMLSEDRALKWPFNHLSAFFAPSMHSTWHMHAWQQNRRNLVGAAWLPCLRLNLRACLQG